MGNVMVGSRASFESDLGGADNEKVQPGCVALYGRFRDFGIQARIRSFAMIK